MLSLLVFGLIVVLLAINIALWKFGFVGQAERPEILMDRPFMDPKERKAFLKRLRRWKTEGKMTVSEFDHLSHLCDAEWDPASEADAPRGGDA